MEIILGILAFLFIVRFVGPNTLYQMEKDWENIGPVWGKCDCCNYEGRDHERKTKEK